MGFRLPRSRPALVGLSLAVITAAAVVSTVLLWGSRSTEPSQPPPATPTVPPDIIANTVEDALRLSAPQFTGYGSTLTVAKAVSVSYVETTVGQARAMFDPDSPGGWGLADDAPAWAIVAYGRFETWCMGCAQHTFGPFSTAWIVVVKGTERIRSAHTNERYDLSKLGSMVEVLEPVWREYCLPGDRVSPNKCSPNP